MVVTDRHDRHRKGDSNVTTNTNENELLALLRGRHRGVLATIKRDGRPQLSNVDYVYYPDQRLLKISVTDGRAKVANLRRDPRASFHVTTDQGWSYAVLEGEVELTPVALKKDDETVAELIEVFRDMNGEHPDWEEYREAMVADRRLVIRLHIDRAYGWIRPSS